MGNAFFYEGMRVYDSDSKKFGSVKIREHTALPVLVTYDDGIVETFTADGKWLPTNETEATLFPALNQQDITDFLRSLDDLFNAFPILRCSSKYRLDVKPKLFDLKRKLALCEDAKI